MTTRAELRAALRRRLEDVGPSPLWDDATLHDALAGALADYGARAPKEAALAVAVPAGATRVPVADPIDSDKIVRVRDGNGAAVPRDEGDAGAAPEERQAGQAWRWWDATGCWTQSHLGAALDGPGRGPCSGRRVGEQQPSGRGPGQAPGPLPAGETTMQVGSHDEGQERNDGGLRETRTAGRGMRHLGHLGLRGPGGGGGGAAGSGRRPVKVDQAPRLLGRWWRRTG